jgi:hypothetical protein
MRTLFMIAIAATLAGCQQAPLIQRPSAVSLPFQSAATNQRVKAKCERKGDDLYVTIQQPAVAGVQSVGVATAPLGGMQLQQVPGRTYRALALEWAKLPLPYLKMHSIPTGPQFAAVPQGGIAPVGGYAAYGGYPQAAYGGYPQAAYGAYPQAAGVMPAGYGYAAQAAMAGQQQNAQLAAMMNQLKAAQAESAAEDTEAERAAELEEKAKALEDKVQKLIEALDGPAKGTGMNTPNTHSWGTNEGVPTIPDGSPIKQTSASRFTPNGNVHQSVELWQHSPQNANRNR